MEHINIYIFGTCGELGTNVFVTCINFLDYLIKQKLQFEISRSTTLACKDIGIKKSEFVIKIQFLYKN